jgi:hypothetical protein
MIRQLKIIGLMLLLNAAAMAQQISPQTINAAGRSISAGGITLEDAIGGLDVQHYATSTFLYTQDFLQPDAGTITTPLFINNVTLDGLAAIDNAGTTFIAGNAMIEFTVGEPISVSLSNATNMLTQGILQPYHYFIWTGLVNDQWIEPGNWNIGVLPIRSDEVLIPPGCPNYPVLENNHRGHCRMLTAQAGTSVTVNAGGLLRLHEHY